MELRRRELFTTIRTEGAILPSDLLQRVAAGDNDLRGLKAADYHLFEGEPLNEAIVRSWNRLVGAWAAFSEARARLPEGDLGTTLTRERWLLILFDELAYGRLQPARAVEIEGKNYAASHTWGEHVPIHLVGGNVPLDRRTRGVAGAAAMSPHGLLQELLNRSEQRLWGFVSNGLALRVLRDNSSLTRQAYVEFDLASMMDGEVYADFVVLWLVCHESRVEGDTPHECWLERWSQEAAVQGTRALDGLRNGVEAAITALGAGFLTHPANGDLRETLRSGELEKQDYYRELLRLAYRLLFLFVAEDRGLLFDPEASDQAVARYDRFYSTRRLRRLAERRRGSKHADLYVGLRFVMERLGDDDGCPALGLPALGSYLWSGEALPHLGAASLPNIALLDAVRALATLEERGVRRSVDYRNLGAEELGSVYESLLELHPDLNVDAGAFALVIAAGNERKTTGSYYTPAGLISCLLDSALEPVLDTAAAHGEEALLNLKVVDPACGSGHFLVSAAHRIAKRLAALRTGDDEPSPAAVRQALRDVVGRCLYGVDVNPMAVELCKVSLWMEALEPGRPLSFLDAHVKCGNSLLGTTVGFIGDGISDDAFAPLEGDDKDIAKSLRRQNKTEREGQLTLEDATADLVGALERRAQTLELTDDASIDALHAKERLFADLIASAEYERAKLAADAWCAAFAQQKEPGSPRITTGVVRRIATGGEASDQLLDEVREIAGEYGFFHWEVEFPQVFGRETAGFDVVLGNPPWERVKLQEKEFFAGHPEIVGARNAASRKKVIAALEADDPSLYRSWLAALRRSAGETQMIRTGGRYPFCGRGDVNTYSVFTELMRSLAGRDGRVGCVVPTGIATDATTAPFFNDLVRTRSLVSLFDFRNHDGLFYDVGHRRFKFCLLTLAGTGDAINEPEFVFFAESPEDTTDSNRRFTLRPEDFALLNPNTGNCPVFRTSRDAELTKAVFRRVAVLVNESHGHEGNPWDVSFMAMFHMANDSHLFRTREELEAEAFVLAGNVFQRDSDRFLPLYESKMIHQFDYRFGDYRMRPPGSEDTQLPDVPVDLLEDPTYAPLPRYWVSEEEVDRALGQRWPHRWFIGWRDICRNTDERTMIASLVPRVAVAGTFYLLFANDSGARGSLCLVANLDSFVFDYVSRQKAAGTHLNLGIIRQLPVLGPKIYEGRSPWAEESLGDWIALRAFELVHTADATEPLAADLGRPLAPFSWDPDRRALLRAELDAAFCHLYGLGEDDVDYVLETFPIVRRRDEVKYGHFRTKSLILQGYREMAAAIVAGRPYRTSLDPPPADPRVTHGSLQVGASVV